MTTMRLFLRLLLFFFLVVIYSDAFGTHRLSFHRVEGLSRDRLLAIPADETIWVPLAVECRYVILHNSAITAAALRSEHVKVILAAIRLAVSLVEALFAKLLAALSAEEMLGMPGLLQSSHAFIKNRPVAVSATR